MAKVLLLQDHLGAQKKGRYVQKLNAISVESVYGPKNKTERWQPIGAGHIGAVFKQLCKVEWDIWLDQSTVSPPMKN